MQVNIKYNVGDKIKRLREYLPTISHSGSHTEQTLRVERIIIERGNSFNRWRTKFYYECQDIESGDFVKLNDEEIGECSSANNNFRNKELYK